MADTSAVAFLLQAAPWTTLDVRRGSVAEVSVRIGTDADTAHAAAIDAEECLVWQFELDDYDIGFQVLQDGTPVRDNVRYYAISSSNSSSAPTQPSATSRSSLTDACALQADCTSPIDGTLEPLVAGSTYTLRWDNSYSLVRHKRLRYRYLATSKRAFAAADAAARETMAKRSTADSNKQQRESTNTSLRPHVAHTLAQQRVLSPTAAAAEQRRLIETLTQCVTDVIALFMTKPDSPLHEGAARAFVLALETVLRHGIKARSDAFLGAWPEEPYCAFLLETRAVLRDDHGLVAQVQALALPTTLQFIGWTRARAFICLALNKKLLHRALENLTKRRTVVERYYEPHAVLFDYVRATQIASFLSALNAVTFLLAPAPVEPPDLRDAVPTTLLQCAPDAPLCGRETLVFCDSIDADSALMRRLDSDPDAIARIQDCSLPRYLLHEQAFTELQIGRGSVAHVPLAIEPNESVLVFQLHVLVQDLNVSLAQDETTDVTAPVLVSAADRWIECVVRFATQCSPLQLSIKLDNAFSIVRTKHVRLRYRTVTDAEYISAWEACVAMAQAMSWKRAARAGAERCAQFIDSLRLQEDEAIEQQRSREASAVNITGAEQQQTSQHATDESILGIPASLIANPVSYLVGGILTSESSACAQCMTPFSFFSRQRACPACQRVVCIPCSRHYVRLSGKGPEVKTCDRCFLKEMDSERKRRGVGSGQMQQMHGGECAAYAALRRDPSMDKYFKMLGFGVPASGVAQKMAQDNVERATIDVFTAGPSGPNELASSRTRRDSTGAVAPGRMHRRSSSAFRKVHWTSLETARASESIWSRVTARRKTAPITLSSHDVQALEQLFGDASTGATTSSRTEPHARSHKRVSALDSRRANNISIALSQFKALGGSDAIVRSVRDCDFAFLTSERLASLYDIAPTSVEAKRYANFRGARARLEPAERFLVDMCAIPRVTEKLAAMLFAAQFDHQQRELRDRINAITRACDQVLHSERLARCFELVLAIGNLLNAGTDLGDAHGVTLASLLKLSETKSVDRTTTLLQFIIKLIHDRGEGDILLFVHDLATLADAKRFSNVICVSQSRALQSGIAQIETEIQEEMVFDLKRFRIDEQRRRAQFEQQQQQQQRDDEGSIGSASTHSSSSSIRPPLGRRAADVTHSDPRSALAAAIRQRESSGNKGDSERRADASDAAHSNSHAMLMAAIAKCQLTAAATSDERPTGGTSGRRELLSAIQTAQRQSPLSREGDGQAALKDQRESTHQLSSSETAQQSRHDARTALLASIATRRADMDNKKVDLASPVTRAGSANPRAALLAAIAKRGAPQSALRATWNGSVSESTSHRSESASSDATVQFVPREYAMDSKFITDMRQRLLEIKSTFEDVEMALEAMTAAWDATARYLGEDPSASSSEYVFSLLNRFRLDVKVVMSLLFRKGVRFASDLHDLLPNAHVGSMIATTFGPGVVTALRVVERRIEVKFPWSSEASLSPSCILAAGNLVRVRVFGVGVIRDTRFDDGFCVVRFPFGIGVVHVRDIAPETSSNANSLRHAVLQSPFCVGDPVVTPFGCGHVQSIQQRCWQRYYSRTTAAKAPSIHSQRNREDATNAMRDGVLVVRLLASDLRSSNREHDEPAAGTAFVRVCDARLNY